MEKDTPSNSELFRGITDLKLMIKDNHDVQLKQHEENSHKLSDLNTKVAVQNGRVASTQEGLKMLGDTFTEYVKNNDSNIGVFKRWVWVITGIVIVVSIFGAIFSNLWFNYKFDERFQTTLDSAAKDYDRIIIDNQ